MTPDQAESARAILAATKTAIPNPTDLPLDAAGLSALLSRDGIVTGSFDWHTHAFTGVTQAGRQASDNLARSLRDGLGEIGKRSANPAVAALIRAYVARHWHPRASVLVTDPDLEGLENAVVNWLTTQDQTRHHFIPCTLFEYKLPPIVIGPVTFHYFSDLPTPAMGCRREEFWPDSKRDVLQRLRDAWLVFRGQRKARWLNEPGTGPGGWNYDRVVELCHERRAYWIAQVEVRGREQAQSIVVADFAASIAISALKLALFQDDLRLMSRASERAAPIWSADVFTTGGRPQVGLTNKSPGRSSAPKYISFELTKGLDLLQSMGRRLDGYVLGQSALAALNESWCSAAYWYHNALLEPVDAVAVAQLETAIEVLLSPGSTKESNSRLVGAIDGLLGMQASDPIAPGSPVDVKSFVAAIVTARSRVLHGTWSTLDTDLPQRNGLGVKRGDVEALARHLLVVASETLDAYEAAGETTDDILALMSWAKTCR